MLSYQEACELRELRREVDALKREVAMLRDGMEGPKMKAPRRRKQINDPAALTGEGQLMGQALGGIGAPIGTDNG